MSFNGMILSIALLVCFNSQQTSSFTGSDGAINLKKINDIMKSQQEIKNMMKGIKKEISDIKDLINNMAQVVTNTEPSCKIPFVSIGEDGKCYYFSPNAATWHAAREACVGLAGDLAELTTLEQRKAVQKYMEENGMTGEFGIYYIGATDRDSPRKFKWLSGDPVTEGWRNEEPNQTHPGNGCLWFYEGEIGDASYSCTGSYKYICQI